MQTITADGLAALRNRALQGILTGAYLGKTCNVAFFQGHINLLDAIGRGLASVVADKDAMLGGHQPLAGFEAAWATLPAGIERMTMTQVQEHLRAKGVEMASDTVSKGEVDAVFQVEYSEIATLNGNNESLQAFVESNNGTSEHGAPSFDATVAQGGAA